MDEAELLYRRALSIRERSFGKEHPDVAIDLNNLASLLQDTNRMAEAEPLYRRALSIMTNYTRITGQHHTFLKTVTDNYTDLLQRIGYNRKQINDRFRELDLDVSSGVISQIWNRFRHRRK
jgi:hypothetical protein